MRQLCVVLALLTLIACNRGNRSSGPPEPRVAPGAPLISYADMVDHVAPAVVTIRSARRVRAPQQFPFMVDPFFRQFFGNGAPRRQQEQIQRGLGSGVIVQADGHILTNHHVIDGAEDIKVDLGGSRQTYSAKLVGSDPPSDLAVLKINASGLPVLQLADSDKVKVGDVCLAVGNPLGIGESVTAGIISAKGRATGISDGNFQDFLQTDAPINQGNSGGALVNTRGELVGINSQILSPTGGNIGIGFAIPSNMAKSVMSQLIGKGKVNRGKLGVTIQPMTSDLAQGLGMKEARGVLVSDVSAGGPAEKAGMKGGDVILEINGKKVNDPNELRNTVAAISPGTEVTVTFARDGAEQQAKAKLDDLDIDAPRAAAQGGEQGAPALGVGVVPLTPDLVEELGLRRGTQGVVIQSVDPNGPAAEAGLRPGDVIQEVNQQPVRTPPEMRAALQRSGGRPPLLLVNRRGQTQYVSVRLAR